MSAPVTTPAAIDDPTNAAILKVSEDRIPGFHREPFGEISRLSGVPTETVLERIQAMLRAGTIRRVRQTLLATNLAEGALVAWKVPQERLQSAFDYLFEQDPFSGHVVIRSTDTETTGSVYRLWTTLKVPQGFSLEKHATYLQSQIGAEGFRLMPAKRLFVLGVGHLRRRELQIGDKSDTPAEARDTQIVSLTPAEWQVLVPLKREFTPEEITVDPWRARATEAGMAHETFCNIAQSLAERGVIGRFSTFLEHVKATAGDLRVTRYNALFHWRVPVGRELEAGQEVGRFHCMTHAYWREGGAEFANVNIMGVAHGMEKERVLAHKAAIDTHLEAVGIPVSYTNVFWGGRSEIKPSEIAPQAYRQFCEERGIPPEAMRVHH
jgi:DNA-binding Lrp family transcriptional regulator